ncbi:Uncharacterised protein [Cedecea davisae]|uniref:Uncharacterized protein n=1 Tax=Cedecea davisae DSM 4568 TaxID=566551 RepID=S3IVI6_9ENTR|nr:hypothetical protein [Cedecea davisae]EPF17733.1 hypothetical protein HMPREF0201_01713 [Cedecea davisae DSM 4568]SUX28044.1 Uncharacterised protein [Cedecea davisae]
MNIIALAHIHALKYPGCYSLFDPASLKVADPDNTTVITFAGSSLPARRMSALDRLDVAPEGDIVLSYFDSSPLGPQLLWDAAHRLPVGKTLYLQASDEVAEILSRSYYRDAFCETARTSSGVRSFTKTGALMAEADRGLDAWSFCIPTGNGDPALLNDCVARILALNIPQFEIILCGRPREDFLYWQQVRIVGEDISAPPVHITRKKNVLAQEAHYPNLCILHDRVLLPLNFYQAVRQFGDDYPFVGFQSFWFADKWQAVPRRYSDTDVATVLPDINFRAGRVERKNRRLFESMRQSYRHPERASFGREYLTGSLYLCKKSVWAHLPQNEDLYWQEYEDVEQGLCAAAAGIPSRINPYSLTSSNFYRSVFHCLGRTLCMKKNGRVTLQRAPQELWGFPRRPHLGISQATAVARLSEFAHRYIGDDSLVRQSKSLIGVRRYILIARLLWAAKGDTTNLVDDWHSLVLCEPAIPQDKEYLQSVLDSIAGNARKKINWLRHPSLSRQLYNNPFSSPFLSDDGKPVFAGPPLRAIGSLISAVWLKYGCSHTAIRLPLFELWRLLISCNDVSHTNNSGVSHEKG